jgi:hypothetical protein
MNPATKQARVPEQVARRERGSALRIAGWLVLLSNLIVLFYMPAAQKIGRQRPYEIAVGVLVAIGVSLIVVGTRIRRSGD